MRIRFRKGEQRKFLDLVVDRLNCVSLRGILERGFDISYDCLKSYYSERRLFPGDFFDDLCHLAKIDISKLKQYGYNPKIKIEEGIARLVKFYLNEGQKWLN